MLKIIKADEIEKYLKRSEKKRNATGQAKIVKQVEFILDSVKESGDRAVREFTAKFDKVELKELKLPKPDIAAAVKKVKKDFIEALREAIENIRRFHENQKPEEWFEPLADDAVFGMRTIPIEKVGVYVPGGRATYPSTVLMNVIPAQVAGVKQIILCSPPPVSPYIIAAAAELGINDIYQAGGAQAIAAMAYGTESVPKVDKIVGPGNIYVATAKRMVFGEVGIESFAGPSDVLIIADEESEPDFIAADLLAQAEHDPDAASLLVTDSPALADKVNLEIEKQMKKLKRQDVIKASLKENGTVMLVDSMKTAIKVANRVAPEHLELYASPQKMLSEVMNAGAVFMGPYSPVAVGDYIAGPNHVLPTGGTARFSSPLTVYDFVKRQSILGYTKPALMKVRKSAELLANLEGLDAHARSISIRFS
ncbi:MAG TPA: histidinol dehydrogenase [Candidatus Omnitrophota bacterium]|nr:histidinol dehydrogenase [Candidatus Omnitrophota bacterium]